MKRDVFISYSRRNIERVKEIKSEIDAQCGTDCWIDLQGIESGSEMFLRDIVGGIDACKVFLFMLSCESMESEYALLELNYAKEQGKRVVLVNIDDCQMTGVFLFKYSLTDTIAWNNSPQREKLLRDVKRWVCEQAEQVSQAEQLVVEQQRKDEAERKAKAEEERKKQEEAERRAKEEAERKAKAEEERKRREEAERRAKEEAERKAREEAARKAKAEEERKKQEEEEQKYIVVGIGKKVVDILEDVPQGATHIRIADGVEEICTPNSSIIVSTKNKSIASVIIPSSVKRIGESAFRGCSGLTSINIPNSVTAIGSGAFSHCTGLTSINIPNSVTAIGSGAFSNCSGLTTINIPNSVTAIGICAFRGCRGLTSINIPNRVFSIDRWIFDGCSGLTSITVDTGNTRYDSRNNCNAIIETASNSLIVGCKNTVIPNSVTDIESHAFEGCSGMTSINIPNSVTAIGYCTFYGCSGLTSINVPNSVTAIGDRAFEKCSGLTSIHIPRSVKTIGGNAFSGCDRLERATIYASTRYVKNIFRNTDDNTFPKHTKITKRWLG